MIVDCHCHAGIGDGLTGPWDTAARIGPYLRRAAQAGIDRTVLFAAFHSDYTAGEPRGRSHRREPGATASTASHSCIPSATAAASARSCETAVGRYGFCGIKVHRHDARITREVCEVARAFDLPVLYDVMGEVSVVELLAREYPDRDVRHPAPRLRSPTTGAPSWR